MPITSDAAGVLRPETLITLTNAALRVRDRLLFPDISWKIVKGEHWAVVGPNGAGKSTLVRALAGHVPVVRGEIIPAEPGRLRQQAAIVSFEKERGMITREDRREESRHFSGQWAGGIRVRDLLRLPHRMPAKGNDDMVFNFHLEHLSDRTIHDLSSGEMRRFQIALALAAAPRLLILDEPFEGLDIDCRNELTGLVRRLMDRKRSVVLVTHRQREILPSITHVLGVKDGRVVFQGPREDVLKPEVMDRLYAPALPRGGGLPGGTLTHGRSAGPKTEALIDLQKVHVSYGGVSVFEDLCWTVQPGEHWALCGPNGSGKTTLLRLIVGDHPQAYVNAVRVFGKRRGPGSSIREVKDQIGMVSSELQVRYRKNVTAIEAVLSGFFSSVGLYRRPAPQQTAEANRWMVFLGIPHLAGQLFHQLSHGEQRMVLLARAMVKSPKLLILDEPCQGLDRTNRKTILDMVDQVAAAGSTTILYVSHHPEEIPASVTRRLTLVGSGAGPFRAVSSAV